MLTIITTMTFVRKVKVGKRIYLAEVKNARKDGKVKQEFIRYLGREIDGKAVKKVATNNIEIKNVKQSLDVLAIDKIAEELHLKSLPYPYILALVYSQLLEKRSINKLEDWIRFTEIPEILGLDKVSVKKLYESLTDIHEEDFEKINDGMNSVFRSYEETTDAAIVDVTDTYFSGTHMNLKKRKGKDSKISKLIQVGLAVSFKNAFPIIHKQYQGNLSGINIFKDMALELKNKDLSSIILDRGMISLENLQLALHLQFDIIAGLRKTKTLVKQFISHIERDEIYTAKCRVKLKQTSVFIREFEYLNGTVIVVYNPSLEVVKKELNFEKEIENSFDIGYSLIYHNTKYSSEEVVRTYYDKEMIERAFKHLKGILNLRPIRVWLTEHIEGHIKICYLGYAILSLINYKLKKLNISAVDALDSLKHGYKVNLRDATTNFEWSIHVPLEPKQKKILEALGVVTKN